MACDCGTVCSCVIRSGSNTVIYGSGSQADPYVVETIPKVTGAVAVADSPTVDMSMTGSGTLADPYVIEAEANLGGTLVGGDTDTITVTIAGDSPATVTASLRYFGDLLSAPVGYVLTRMADGTWAGAPGNVVSPGVLHVGPGLVGDGSIANPLHISIPTYADARALQNP